MSQDYGQIIKWSVAGAVVVGVGYWLINRDKNQGSGFLASIGNALAKIMPSTYVVYDAQGNKTTKVLLPGETNPIIAKDATIRAAQTPVGTPVDVSKISIGDRIFANIQGKTLPGDIGYNEKAADAIWSESATWYDTLVNSSTKQ